MPTLLLDAPTLTDAGADGGGRVRSRIPVAKLGDDFKDKRYGTFAITAEQAARWKSNLAAQGGSVAIDRDHTADKPGGSTKAAAWITDLAVEGDKVMADVEWTPEGANDVRNKYWRFISPTFVSHYKDEQDRDLGDALIGAALTNRPFLRAGMPAINLSTTADADVEWEADDTDPDVLALAISATDRQKHAVVVKKVDGQTRHMFPIPDGDKVHARAALSLLPKAIAAGHITEAEAGQVRERANKVLGNTALAATAASGSSFTVQIDGNAADLNRALTSSGFTLTTATTGSHDIPTVSEYATIAKALGLDSEADEATIVATARELSADKAKTLDARASDDGKVLLSTEVHDDLKARAEKGDEAVKSLAQRAFDTAYDKAVDEGRIAPAQKDELVALYAASPEHTIKLIDGAQKIVNTEPTGSGGGAPEPVDPSKADHKDLDTKVQAFMLTMDTPDYAKALDKVLAGATA